MLKFDKIKIVSDISNIEIYDEDIFEKKYKNDVLTELRYMAEEPYFQQVMKKKKRKLLSKFPLSWRVRWARLELAQDYSHYPLKVACLPFHHHRVFELGLQRYNNFLNLQIFSKIFWNILTFCLTVTLIQNVKKTQVIDLKCCKYGIYFILLRDFPRVGKERYYFINF